MSEHFKHLPSSWEIQPLSAFIAHLESGVSVNADDRTVVNDEIGVLSTSCAAIGRFMPEEHKAVWSKDIKRVRVNPRAGEIIISRMNTPSLVGETGFVKKTEPRLYLPDRLWQTVARASKETDFGWLNQVLQWAPVRKAVRDVATGTSNSMKNISKRAFLAIQVPTPPLNEQRNIAEVLSSLDEQIEQTEAGVKKYQRILDGLIHDLLMSGPRNAKLGELADIRPKTKSADLLSSVPFVPMDAVSEEGRLEAWNLRPWAQVSSGFTRFASNDVLVAKITPCFENGKGAHVPIGFDVWAGSTEFHVLRAKEGANARWIFWYTRSREFRESGAARMTGSAGQQRVPRDFLEKFPVRAISLDDQKSAAEALDYVDAVINTGNHEVAKLCLQKQGLMRDLLTGAIRVS